MSRPRSADIDEATRERLLKAAARAFAKSGSGARLEDIAKDAGIRRSSLLYHFESKDLLYAAVIENAFCELERNMLHVMRAPNDFEARLKAVVDALIGFEEHHRALLSVLTRSLLEEDESARDILERSFVPLIDKLEAFVRAGTKTRLKKGFPLRAAILQLIVAHMVHSAMGDAGNTLWKGQAHTWMLTKTLLGGATTKPRARLNHE